MRAKWLSTLLTASVLAGGLLVSLAASGQAATPEKNRTDHERVPVVVDGVRYTPEQMHRFDGQTLYYVVDVNSDEVLAYTTKSQFEAVVAQKEAALDKTVTPASAGQYATVYSGDDLTGDSLRIDSGSAYTYLGAVCRGWFCSGNWDNLISSVYVHGSVTFYEGPNFNVPNYPGNWLWVGGDGRLNLAPIPSVYPYANWNDIASSLAVWW